MTVDAAARKEVIESLVKRLNDAYIFPDVAAQDGAGRPRALAKGEYEQITSAK